MNNRKMHIDAPPVPEHFIEARERTLELIQKGEAWGAPLGGLKRSVALAIVFSLLLLAAGAAAAVNHFGILDYLNWSNMSAPADAGEVILSDLGKTEGEWYTASVEEAYFDGRNYMLTVRYDVKNPQDALFVNSLSGYWREDEGFYRVFMTGELQGSEDPWQTINEYEDATGGTRTRISAIDPQIIGEKDISWNAASVRFHQPDGSLLYVIHGTLEQPEEAPAAVSVRCGAVIAGTEKPAVYEEITIVLKPSETVWQAQYVPEGAGDGWAMDSLRIASGKLLARMELKFTCAPGTLTGGANYCDIEVRDESDNAIEVLEGLGGSLQELSDGGVRFTGSMCLMTPDGQPDVLRLYLKRDGALPLGPIVCVRTND